MNETEGHELCRDERGWTLGGTHLEEGFTVELSLESAVPCPACGGTGDDKSRLEVGSSVDGEVSFLACEQCEAGELLTGSWLPVRLELDDKLDLAWIYLRVSGAWDIRATVPGGALFRLRSS